MAHFNRDKDIACIACNSMDDFAAHTCKLKSILAYGTLYVARNDEWIVFPLYDHSTIGHSDITYFFLRKDAINYVPENRRKDIIFPVENLTSYTQYHE